LELTAMPSGLDLGLNLEYASLILFAIATCITPGPNNTMILASGLNYGVRASLPHLFGINIGFPLMVLAVGAGIGGLFVAFPILGDILKVVGSAYLLYLAWRIATAGPPSGDGEGGRPLTFTHAALFQLVNPKAWMMAVSAVSVYSVASESYLAQIVVIAAVFLVFGTPCTGVWLGFGSGLRRWLSNRTVLRAFHIAMAGLLVASLIPVLIDYVR
jgi:threonine/homoserine/homoserine lactone efflux protein